MCRSGDWEKVGMEQRLGLTEIEDWPEEWSRIGGHDFVCLCSTVIATTNKLAEDLRLRHRVKGTPVWSLEGKEIPKRDSSGFLSH